MGSSEQRNDEQAPVGNEIAEHAVPDHNSITGIDEDVIEGSPGVRAPRLKADARTRELAGAARHFWTLGLNVLTVGGAKRPNVGAWQEHRGVRQSAQVIAGLPYDSAYGVAGICGEVSGGIACLDFDKVDDDRRLFLVRQLRALGLPSDYAWAVVTPSGAHVWVRLVGDLEAVGNRGKLVGHVQGCHHVELRYDGHYALLPPSRRQDGGSYQFINSSVLPVARPDEVAFEAVLAVAEWDEARSHTEAPRGALPLVGRTVGPQYVESAVQGEIDKVRSATEGCRNDMVFKASAAIGSLLHLGVDEDEVADRLFEAAQETGLPDDEIASAIRSGLRAGIENPRDLVLRDSAAEAPRPPYPLHVLPAAVRDFVVEAAECVGCPPDMIAVPLLGYAAATIGRTRSIQIKAQYEKHPVFWFGVVGSPGSGKSPADGQARSFVEMLQAKAYAAWQTAYQEWRTEHEQWKQRVKSKGSGRAMAGGESFHVDPEPEEPVLEHYFTTDATIEALAPMLQSSAGVAVAHDELVGWVKSMGAYNGAAGRDRAQFLSLWAESSLKVDRKGRPPLYIEHPVAVVIGGVQPDVLVDLAGEADKRDGFIDRFLWAWPEHRPAPWTEATVDAFTAARVETIFRRLRHRGAATSPVTLSDDAKAFWCEWYDANSMRTQSERGIMAGIHTKADVHLARLALVLHVLAHDDPEALSVSVETLRAAAELVEYHLAHARAVVQRLGAASMSPRTGRGSTLRQRIIARLQDHGGWMSVTDIAKDLGGHVSASDRDAELERLEDEGLVQRRVKPSGELGGRPAIQWRYYERTCELENPERAA